MRHSLATPRAPAYHAAMSSPLGRLADRFGLTRPELRAWALYDWANSAFFTVVVTAIFPLYFHAIADGEIGKTAATSRFTIATTLALTVTALVAPLLGAFADARPVKKRLLGGFLLLGAGATAAMALIGPGDITFALLLFVIGNVGVSASFVFYDALLPHVARPDELDRVSTAGYALGYVGGGLLLAIDLALLFLLPDRVLATRLCFLSVAVWWVVFALPLFRHVPEPRVAPPDGARPRGAFRQLAATLRELRRYPEALLFLVAFLLYNDGIGTIIRLSATYGLELGLSTGALVGAILLVQVVGIPSTFLFGRVADRVGARPAIVGALGIYAAITLLAWRMTDAWQFYVVALLVGLVQGGTQALSRSLFAKMIPRARSTEFFALFAVFEKFAGILGPALFAVTLAITGSSRSAILGVLVFFIAGGLLLSRVDLAAGRRRADEANEAALTA